LAAAGLPSRFIPSSVARDRVPEYANVIEKGEEYATLNLQGEPHFAARITAMAAENESLLVYQQYLQKAKSELAVPLHAEGRLVGTATLQSATAGFFDASDERLLFNSMKYAGELIAQCQLAERIQHLQDEIKAEPALRHLPWLLRHLAHSAVELLGADIVSIYEYDQERDEFRQSIIDGALIHPRRTDVDTRTSWLPRLMVARPHTMFEETREDLVRWWTELRAAAVPGAAAPLPSQPNFITRERINAAAALILEASQNTSANYGVVGVMFFNFRKPQRFTESRRHLMRMFASVASIAIRNARLHDMVARSSIEDIFGSLEAMCQRFGADAGHVRLFDPTNGTLEKIAALGYASAVGRRTIRAGEPIAGRFLSDTSPVIDPNVHAEAYPDWEGHSHVRSFACLPLIAKRFVGSVLLTSQTENTFRPEMEAELGAFCASEVTPQVAKRYVYERSTRRLALLRDLDDYLKERRGADAGIALVLTAVTMSGGLEFNRALIFVPDDDGLLVCRYGIYPGDETEAKTLYEKWSDWRNHGLEPTLEGLTRLLGGSPGLLEANLKHNPQLPGDKQYVPADPDTQCLAEAFGSGQSRVVTVANTEADDVVRQLDAIECAVIPLVFGGHSLGVLYVDNKFTPTVPPIDDDDLVSLRQFAQRAAAVLDDERQTLERTRVARLAHSARWSTARMEHAIGTPLFTASAMLGKLHALEHLVKPAQDEIERALRVAAHWRSLARDGRFDDAQSPKLISVDTLLDELLKTVKATLDALRDPYLAERTADVPVTRVRLYLDLLKCDFENFAKDSRRLWRQRSGEERLAIKLDVALAGAGELAEAGLDASATFIKVSYHDNGPGIPTESKKAVFLGTDMGEGRANGIGLGAAKFVAQLHRGAIAESGAPGKGVQFDIYLPVSG
jgi:GAF domain-containing protein